MTGILLGTAVAMLATAIPYVGRAIAGPTAFDRVVALNGIGTKVPVLIVLAGLLYGRAGMFLDIALGLFLLGLVTTLLVARYVKEKGGI